MGFEVFVSPSRVRSPEFCLVHSSWKLCSGSWFFCLMVLSYSSIVRLVCHTWLVCDKECFNGFRALMSGRGREELCILFSPFF